MRCDELKPDYLLYTIGAVGEPERSEILAHLESGCETCTAGLREARALAYSMGALVDGPEPPPELRRGVLAISGAAQGPARASQVQSSRISSFFARPIAAWQGLALAAACLALALAPAVVWRRAAAQAEAEKAVASAGLAKERQSAAELRDQLAKLEKFSFRADPIVPLELERGAAGAVKPIVIPQGATAIVLAIPSDLVRQASSAELHDASDRMIRSISPLAAGGSDATGLTIDAGLLPPGPYSLVLRAGERTIATFPFRVDRR